MEPRKTAGGIATFAEDVVLLHLSRPKRCHGILRKLSSMGEDPDAFFARQSLVGVIEEVVEPFRDLGTDLEVRRIGEDAEPIEAA